MKAPEQTYAPQERGIQQKNHSMLPPDKLPNSLLEKPSPTNVYNFSMQASGNQLPLIEKLQESAFVSREVPMQAPLTVPEAPTTNDMASIVETPDVQEEQELSAAMPIVPANTTDQLSVESPPTIEGTVQTSTNEPESPKEENATVEGAEAGTAFSNGSKYRSEGKVEVSEDNSAPAESLQAPSPPIRQPEPEPSPQTQASSADTFQLPKQQEYPFNSAAPPSFIDSMLNNSNTAIIIVAGIIFFALAIILLLSLSII
jgi:hypothetical protein